MKQPAQTLRPIAVIGIGLLLAVTSAVVSQPVLPASESAAAALSIQATATSTLEAASEVGSTDGIMLLSILIVVIVVVPILLRRLSWAK